MQEIHPDDEYVADIVRALQRTRDERIDCKAIFEITIYHPDHVRVSTGRVRGPWDAGGDFITFVRERGVWRVESVGQWIS